MRTDVCASASRGEMKTMTAWTASGPPVLIFIFLGYFLVNSETRHTGGATRGSEQPNLIFWAFLLTVKRDSQGERTSKKSFPNLGITGELCVRVRAVSRGAAVPVVHTKPRSPQFPAPFPHDRQQLPGFLPPTTPHKNLEGLHAPPGYGRYAPLLNPAYPNHRGLEHT